ncbi:MAG: hypothetical protein U9R00_03440, partial [Patescibacteria group bacterium]|nr:hypothetical protein [Patescibacteria group bacterium]
MNMPYTDKKGRVYKYGEFFPTEMFPFAYNESIAQEFFPKTKEEALNQGYSWTEPEDRNYSITLNDVPDNIKDIDDSITKEIIGCEHKGECNQQCTTAFKIIPDEFQFYKANNIPLPNLCPNCRHYERLNQRNPIILKKDLCKKCNSEIETVSKNGIIYCKKCYQNEVN